MITELYSFVTFISAWSSTLSVKIPTENNYSSGDFSGSVGLDRFIGNDLNPQVSTDPHYVPVGSLMFPAPSD